MKTISLWEPWASAIAKGIKLIETRSWKTAYRGPLAIHASRTKDHVGFIYWPEVREYYVDAGITDPSQLRFGEVVAVCDLVDCVPTQELIRSGQVTSQEGHFGNYEPGRFGWKLENIRPLVRGLSWRGSQGFFGIPDTAIEAALKQSEVQP